MTREEIREELDKLGLYYDPDHPDHISREKIDTMPPPFMEWGTQERYIRADGVDYLTYQELTVRIYADHNEDVDITAEDGKTVDETLRASFDRFRKNRYYNDELLLYETDYTMEV